MNQPGLARWLPARARQLLGLGGVGSRGERIAARALRKSGYRILGRNLRNRVGEVDLLAMTSDGSCMVLVEVKSRELGRGHEPNNQARFDSYRPEVRVGSAKRNKLAALAVQLARKHNLPGLAWRFDVVGVDLGPGRRAAVRHIAGAFESPY